MSFFWVGVLLQKRGALFIPRLLLGLGKAWAFWGFGFWGFRSFRGFGVLGGGGGD